jgi:hypothetical protein
MNVFVVWCYLSLLWPQYFTKYAIAIGEYKFTKNLNDFLCIWKMVKPYNIPK